MNQNHSRLISFMKRPNGSSKRNPWIQLKQGQNERVYYLRKSKWRITMNDFPTRTNHNDRGTDLNSTRCPLCSEDQEPVTHVFCNVKWWLT